MLSHVPGPMFVVNKLMTMKGKVERTSRMPAAYCSRRRIADEANAVLFETRNLFPQVSLPKTCGWRESEREGAADGGESVVHSQLCARIYFAPLQMS